MGAAQDGIPSATKRLNQSVNVRNPRRKYPRKATGADVDRIRSREQPVAGNNHPLYRKAVGVGYLVQHQVVDV